MKSSRFQTSITLLVLLAISFTTVGLGLIARNPLLNRWMEKKNEDYKRMTRGIAYNARDFQLPEEIWIYNDLPHMDFSRGGVYLFGASAVLHCTKLSSLPSPLPSLIRNFGISACNEKAELTLLHYLVERKNMLEAGGDKNLIILNMDYHSTFYMQTLPLPFTDVLEHHGMFICDPVTGLQERHVNMFHKFLDFEETRQVAFLGRLRDLAVHQLSTWISHPSLRGQDAAFYTSERRNEFEPDWKTKVDSAFPVFREILAYLHDRHAKIQVVLMPEGTWETNLPYSHEYRTEVAKICIQEKVPLLDWSAKLEDKDFADYVHPNIYGREIMQSAFLNLALPFLHSTEAFPTSKINPSP